MPWPPGDVCESILYPTGEPDLFPRECPPTSYTVSPTHEGQVAHDESLKPKRGSSRGFRIAIWHPPVLLRQVPGVYATSGGGMVVGADLTPTYREVHELS